MYLRVRVFFLSSCVRQKQSRLSLLSSNLWECVTPKQGRRCYRESVLSTHPVHCTTHLQRRLDTAFDLHGHRKAKTSEFLARQPQPHLGLASWRNLFMFGCVPSRVQEQAARGSVRRGQLPSTSVASPSFYDLRYSQSGLSVCYTTQETTTTSRSCFRPICIF